MHIHRYHYLAAAALGLEAVAQAKVCAPGSAPLVSVSGQSAIIPAWDFQSTAQASTDLATLSRPGAVNTSSWYRTSASRCTVMGCLLDAGEYNDTELFYSTNLAGLAKAPYEVPWLYRHEFALNASAGQHFILQTLGVTSRAEIYLNGQQVADSVLQSGTYGGHAYDVTGLVGRNNALLVRAHPTNYLVDFGQGFVDWNPYPPDNGTGVWRSITLKQVGPVSLGPLYVTTDFKLPPATGSGTVTLRATARNLENSTVTVTANGLVSRESGEQPLTASKTLTLSPGQATDVILQATVDSPAIWWPKQWGDQPLYKAQLSVSVGGAVSDAAPAKTFGFRQVTSVVNAHNDTLFSVNGQPFEVLGGGYAPDVFLRWDSDRFDTIARYVLDMGLNTIRLEGKMEQPEMFEAADRLGLMIMPGWECCDKWEAWSYNTDVPTPIPIWSDGDYATANASMYTEAALLQAHPSVLAFLVGSDYWPNDRAAAIYVNALHASGWQIPIICSAAKQGYPQILGPSGLKMDGPYDWVPPNYWYDTDPSNGDKLGAAFGFGSEQSAGVGTPELDSLRRFLSDADLADLWQAPNKGLYHMSTDVSSFHTRTIYNNALWARYGAPTSLEDYVAKAQLMDYEATRAEFEGFAALWGAAPRPATGVIYWMLNGAWPSLHWALFDYYFHPAGAYFGTKVGGRAEHVAYDYVHRDVYLINRSLDKKGPRAVTVDFIGLDGKPLAQTVSATVTTTPNTSKKILSRAVDTSKIKGGAAFVRLVLSDPASGAVLSRNVYWLSSATDALNWDDSTWYYTPVTAYANMTALSTLQAANVTATVSSTEEGSTTTIKLENLSSVPAFFVSLSLVDASGAYVTPLSWSDNYVTLWPHETIELSVAPLAGAAKGAAVEVAGRNVAKNTVTLSTLS